MRTVIGKTVIIVVVVAAAVDVVDVVAVVAVVACLITSLKALHCSTHTIIVQTRQGMEQFINTRTK